MAKVLMVAVIALVKLAENGKTYEIGEQFEVNFDRATVLVEAGTASFLEGDTIDLIGDGLAESEDDEDGEDEEKETIQWPIKNMTPEVYLEKYPNGPKASLAKAVLAQAEQSEDDEGDEEE